MLSPDTCSTGSSSVASSTAMAATTIRVLTVPRSTRQKRRRSVRRSRSASTRRKASVSCGVSSCRSVSMTSISSVRLIRRNFRSDIIPPQSLLQGFVFHSISNLSQSPSSAKRGAIHENIFVLFPRKKRYKDKWY